MECTVDAADSKRTGSAQPANQPVVRLLPKGQVAARARRPGFWEGLVFTIIGAWLLGGLAGGAALTAILGMSRLLAWRSEPINEVLTFFVLAVGGTLWCSLSGIGITLPLTVVGALMLRTHRWPPVLAYAAIGWLVAAAMFWMNTNGPLPDWWDAVLGLAGAASAGAFGWVVWRLQLRDEGI